MYYRFKDKFASFLDVIFNLSHLSVIYIVRSSRIIFYYISEVTVLLLYNVYRVFYLATICQSKVNLV